jgi:hypothetical protein
MHYMVLVNILFLLGLPAAIFVGISRSHKQRKQKQEWEQRWKTADQAKAEGRCVQCALNMPHEIHDNL